MLEAPETCDDGNTAAGDGCDATCQVEPGTPPDPSPMDPSGGDPTDGDDPDGDDPDGEPSFDGDGLIDRGCGCTGGSGNTTGALLLLLLGVLRRRRRP